MHRQGRSPKGSGLVVFMGRAAEGRGTVVMRPFVRFRPAAGRRGASAPVLVIRFMLGASSVRRASLLASACLYTDW